MREEGNGLIKGIARFYIRENQYIGLPIDGRHDALNVTARLLAGCLYVQRAVDNDIPEFAGFGQFYNVDVVQRMGKLGAHFLRTMDKGDARLPDTKMAAGMNGVPNHLYPLLQSGPGNDSGIRKKQQFIIGGNLHYSKVRQNLSFGQQALLFVENGMEQVVCIDYAFHQNVRATLTHDAHRFACGFIFVLDMQSPHILRILLQSRIFFQNSRIANHQKLRNTFIQSAGYGIFSIGVISTNYGNALPLIQGFQVGGQLIKVPNRFHNVRFLANI